VVAVVVAAVEEVEAAVVAVVVAGPWPPRPVAADFVMGKRADARGSL
jgi:hypothetical protein